MGIVVTPEAAIYELLGQIGIPIHAATAVPDEAAFPYATVEVTMGTYWEGECTLVVNLWYYGDSEAAPNAKARELIELIGPGGRILECDGGAVWVKRGSPLVQAMGDESDDKIKRRYVNLIAEYITN